MENLPDNLYEDYTKDKLSWPPASAADPATTVLPPPDIDTIIQWINNLHNMNSFISDFALQNLATHRNDFESLPLLLWKSRFTVTMLLQEILKIYPYIISPPVHSQNGMPIRVYNILLLFQCITHHPETRDYFLKAQMPHYFFPLMDIDHTDKPLECLRLGALGVIAHMLKERIDGDAVRFIMDSGAIHYCEKAIEIGSSESKTIGVFILNKILSTDEGLNYCCVVPERFFIIDGLLKKLLVYLSSMANPSSSLLNLVAGCYAKLSQKPKARIVLRRYLPVMLLDGTFASLLAEDSVADDYRKQLIQNLELRAMN